MAEAGSSSVLLIDNDGDSMVNASGELKVSIGADVDIGDVDIHLSGNVPLLGDAGAVAAGVLRVTLASDDNHFGEVGDGASLTGAVHAQLRAIGNSVSTSSTELETIDASLNNIESYTGYQLITTGGQYSEGDIHTVGIVRNDTLASLVTDDNDYAPLQVNATGALYVDGSGFTQPISGTVTANLSSTDNTVLDNILTKNTEIDTVLDTIKVDTEAIETAVELIDDAVHQDDAGFTLGTHKGMMMMGFAGTQSVDSDDAAALVCTSSGKLIVSIGHTSTTVPVSGPTLLGGSTYSEGSTGSIMTGAVRNDVLDALADTDNECAPLQVDAQGALYTTHGITGLASDDNPTVGTSAEQLITDGADGATACKRVDIMAHPSNTGYIWVGDSAVSVDGLNGGIRLAPGDFYSMDIDNTGDIYVIATVDTENVCYNYFT